MAATIPNYSHPNPIPTASPPRPRPHPHCVPTAPAPTPPPLLQRVVKGLTPDKKLVKVVYDQLVALMGSKQEGLVEPAPGQPQVILMAGLQVRLVLWGGWVGGGISLSGVCGPCLGPRGGAGVRKREGLVGQGPLWAADLCASGQVRAFFLGGGSQPHPSDSRAC